MFSHHKIYSEIQRNNNSQEKKTFTECLLRPGLEPESKVTTTTFCVLALPSLFIVDDWGDNWDTGVQRNNAPNHIINK